VKRLVAVLTLALAVSAFPSAAVAAPSGASASGRAILAASCRAYTTQGPGGAGRLCALALTRGALHETSFGGPGSTARAAASTVWRCSAFVSNVFRTGRDLNVWSFQSCRPQPGYTRVMTCIQIKQGLILTYWKNLHCERAIRSGAATDFVELEFGTACTAGTHKYRATVTGYSFPPAGTGTAGSVKELKTKC
jgi:hypothetical protein